MTLPIMTPRDRRNTMLNVVGESVWGFQWNLVASATVLTVFLREYGAGERQIGAIVAIETAAILVPQVLGMYVFSNPARRKRHLLFYHMYGIIPFLFLLALLAHWAPDVRDGLTLTPSGRLAPAVLCGLLLLGWAAYMTASGVVIAAWNDWWATVFATRIRGTVMGLSLAGASVAGTLAALLAGWLLQILPHPKVYRLLYGGAGVMALLAMIAFFFIDDHNPAAKDAVQRVILKELAVKFRSSLADANFRAFLMGRALATAGFCMVPFITVYYTSAAGGGLASGTVVSCGAAMTVGMALASLVFGRLGDRYGHRLGILGGAATQVLTLGLMLATGGLCSCLLAFAGAGVCAGIGWVSHYNMLFETCPHDNRLAHITIGNLILGLATMVVPLLAGAFAQWAGLRSLFWACLLLSAAAFGWFLVRVREPRHVLAFDPPA